jgi:hypothetical protein
MGPTRPIGYASTAETTRSGLVFSMLMMKDPPMHWP